MQPLRNLTLSCVALAKVLLLSKEMCCDPISLTFIMSVLLELCADQISRDTLTWYTVTKGSNKLWKYSSLVFSID